MAEIIRMPRMSDTMEEGVIVAWLKEVGDEVEPGDVLAEVETDKATMELESFHEGVLLHIGVKEGPVPVNGVLAVIGEAGEDYEAALASAGGEESATASSNGSSPAPTTTAAPSPQPVAEVAHSNDRVKASPLAKSMASDAGINIATIKGSGDNGRVIKRDVVAAIDAQGGSSPRPASNPVQAPVISPSPAPEKKEAPIIQPFIFDGNEGYDEVPLSQMRKAIAKNVVANKFAAPHFYLTIEVAMEKAIDARKKMNEISPVKISFNDLVIKAAAVALRQHPMVNSSWQDSNLLKQHKHISIGVAVATDQGLLLPVIRQADMKSLSQINSEVRSKAGLAKERRLAPEEMQGSTFMISNLGMFGIEEFTAIVNRPNACAMAVGAITDKAVVVDGNVVPGKRMKITLSCDHRVVDGAVGAQFLQTFKSVLEDPIRMLV